MEDIKQKIKDSVVNTMGDYFEKDGEALDGDEVDEIIRELYFELNLINGNITQEEYDEGLEKGSEIIITAVDWKYKQKKSIKKGLKNALIR